MGVFIGENRPVLLEACRMTIFVLSWINPCACLCSTQEAANSIRASWNMQHFIFPPHIGNAFMFVIDEVTVSAASGHLYTRYVPSGPRCQLEQVAIAMRHIWRACNLKGRPTSCQSFWVLINYAHSAPAFQLSTQSDNPRLSYWWFNQFSRSVYQGAILYRIVLRVEGATYNKLGEKIGR